ncbi:MAG: NAD(P)-dependent oxidoreductase [Actinomycetota bacterium]
MKILSFAPLAGPGLDRIRALGELELDPWDAHVPIAMHAGPDLSSRLGGVEVLLVEADPVSGDVIETADSLRVIGTTRGDPVNVDIEAATKAGIPVLRAPGRNADAVAELTIGLIFAVVRGIVAADADVRAGRWVIDERIPQQRYRSREVAGMTVGLVGCGAVGQATAQRLVGLGATVVGFDPYADREALAAMGVDLVELDDLLERADIVSIHAAVTRETRGMLGAAQFARMKHGAYFVNSARFGIADEAALLDALRSGQLAGAGFDHFEGEFLPADHPLLSMHNVVLTPHIGGQTAQTVENHTTWMADGLEALFAGREPPNAVNPEVLSDFFAAAR